jgi:hypothetical protein
VMTLSRMKEYRQVDLVKAPFNCLEFVNAERGKLWEVSTYWCCKIFSSFALGISKQPTYVLRSRRGLLFCLIFR